MGAPTLRSEFQRAERFVTKAAQAEADLRAAAEWLVEVGYPFDFNFTPRAPEALWQEVVNVVHEDATGRLHGNRLTRDEVAEWLVDP